MTHGLSLVIWGTLAVTLLHGCLILPVPTPSHFSKDALWRGSIRQDTVAFIRPGVTTREEVLLALGDPDRVGPACFRYTWTPVQGYLAVGILFAKVVVPREVEHHVVVHFDADGRVETFERADATGIRRPCAAPP